MHREKLKLVKTVAIYQSSLPYPFDGHEFKAAQRGPMRSSNRTDTDIASDSYSSFLA